MANSNDTKQLFNLSEQLEEAKKQFETLKGDLNARYVAWRDAKIEKANVSEMSDHDAWLFDRSLGIGGSDIGALLSMSPYNTRYMLWQDKCHSVVEFEGNNFTKWGNKLESIVAQNFSEEFGFHIIQSPPADSGMMDKSHWLRFNIDFDIPDTPCMGEVKTASGESKANWGAGITPQDFADHKKLGTINSLAIIDLEQCEFPLAYFCQIQYYLMMKNKRYCFLTALIGGNDERHYLIRGNSDFQDLIYYRATYFMFHHVIEQYQPLKTPFEQLQEYVAFDHSGEVDVDENDGLKPKLVELLEIKTMHSKLGKTKKEMEDEIKLILGEKSEIVQDGEILADWKTQERITIDTEAFEDEQPDLFEKYKKVKKSRVLRLKKKQLLEVE